MACHPLKDVKKLAEDTSCCELTVTRAIDRMIENIESVNTRDQAICFASSFIANVLEERNFAKSVKMAGLWADEYAIQVFDLGGWYIKLAIAADKKLLKVFSFHPLEHSLKTNTGEVQP